MDWDLLLRSVVLAAVVSSVVAAIGFGVSAATALKINKDKVKLDRDLAKYKADAERDLVEHRINLDHKLAIARRRAELAEKVLADFYQARRTIDIVRSPMIWAGEMVAEDGVAEDVVKNDGYGVMRRLREYQAFFAEMDAKRFMFGALFGTEATVPYDQFIKVYNRVFHAAESLLRYRHDLDNPDLQQHIKNMRREAFSNVQLDDYGKETADRVSQAVEEAVATIEAICRPAVESELAA
jgi:hypothetical protein